MALGLPDDPRQQRLLLIGIVPLVALFGYWYALHGNYAEERQQMVTRLENLETRNSQARMRAPQSQQLEEQLVKFERHIERLEQLVPRGEEVSRLLARISEEADRIGVSVARFSPASRAEGTHYNRQTYELTVQGTYHEIARFLTEIGSLPRIITPINLSVIPYTMQQSGSGTAEQILEASFVIETYVLPEPQQAAGQGGGAGA